MKTEKMSIEQLKKEVEMSLENHCAGARLIDLSLGCSHSHVLIEAPKGMHWEGSAHALAFQPWFSGEKDEYWGHVMQEVSELPRAVSCSDDPCLGVAEFGECAYWDAEQELKE